MMTKNTREQKGFCAKLFIAVGLLAIAFGFSNCGSKSSDDDESTDEPVTTGTTGTTSSIDYTVEEELPADSTGASSDLDLSFATTSDSDGFSLTDVSQIIVSDSITVTTAKINIAGIKIKAKKERNQAELRLAAKEKTDEEEIGEEEESFKSEMVGVAAAYQERIRNANGQDKEELQAEIVQEKNALKAKRAEERKAKDQVMMQTLAGYDKSMKWQGPYVFDAVAGTFSPELSAISLVDGSYERIEFKLRQYRDGEGDDPLLNNTFYIAGTVNGVPFEVSYHMAENIRLYGADPLKVVNGEANRMIMSFDVKAWFTDVDLSAGDVDESGTIIVDKNSNHEILMQLKKNIKQYARFGKDLDNDGALNTTEKVGDGEEAVVEDGE